MESVPSVARLDENICLEDAFANIFFVVLRIDQIAILTYYCFFGRIFSTKTRDFSLFFIFWSYRGCVMFSSSIIDHFY